MTEETIIKLIDTELTNTNKLIYELKGAYATGDPQLIYFKMRERLEMLENAADWTRIIQSRVDNGEDYSSIARDFINFVTTKYGKENLRWFYRHIEVTENAARNAIFLEVRRAQVH